MIQQLMTLSALCCLVGLLSGCNTQAPPTAVESPQKRQATDPYKGLRGTWARYGKFGFTLIEITDSTHVQYYRFMDRREVIDTITHDRYAYHKSSAKMGYWRKDSTTIWIATDQYRFDYQVEMNGDLTEYDKMGDQGTFVKVPKSEE